MKLITFGLGGPKATFLRLGFGSSAAAQQTAVNGGYPAGRRLFRPAYLGRPILLDVEETARIALVIAARSETSVGQAARSRLALPSVRASSRNSAARASTSALHLRASAGVAAQTFRRASAGRVTVRLLPASRQTAVREERRGSALRFRASCASSLTRTDESGARIQLRVVAQARKTATREASRAVLRPRAASTAEWSTFAERVAEMDRRDLDLILLLASSEE